MIGSHFDVAHIDEGALDWAIKKWGVKSFVDVGCGLGKMVDLAKDKGLEAYGVEGDEAQGRRYIDVHDYKDGPLEFFANFDLGWSTEFVEHIEECYVSNFMMTFKACKRVIMTHALPPNSPPGHVNCQEAEYWVRTFRQWGFSLDEEATKELREVSTMEREFMKRTGKVFVRL